MPGTVTGEEMDRLLSHLPTEVGRARFIYRAMSEGTEVPHEYLERAFETFKTEGQRRASAEEEQYKKWEAERPYLNGMADIAYALGRDKEAMKLFSKVGRHGEAAELAEKLGLVEEAVNQYELAANRGRFSFDVRNSEEAHQQRSALLKFFELAEASGQHERIIYHHLNNRNIEAAAGVAKKHELVEKILEDLKRKGVEAEQSAEKDESRFRSREERVGMVRYLKQAGQFAEAAGLTDEAIKVYIEEGNDGRAISLAERVGKHEVAVELHKKKGELGHAAHAAQKAGDAKTERELRTEMLNKAENKGDWYEVHRLAEELGLTEKAIEACEKNGNFTEAIRIAKKSGMDEKLRELRKMAMAKDLEHERYGDAAKYAERLGLAEEAEAYRKMSAIVDEEGRDRKFREELHREHPDVARAWERIDVEIKRRGIALDDRY